MLAETDCLVHHPIRDRDPLPPMVVVEVVVATIGTSTTVIEEGIMVGMTTGDGGTRIEDITTEVSMTEAMEEVL
jgi:hypothetical protein